MITQEVINWLKQDFNEQSNELYYFSLEALKKMCDNNYSAAITYGLDGGAVIGRAKQYRWNLVESKIIDLDQFAEIMHISKKDMKYIVKGKWFLASWCDYLSKKAKELYSECGKNVPQCEFCKVGQNNKCLWKPSSSFQFVEIESLLYSQQFIDLTEVEYIYEYIERELAC